MLFGQFTMTLGCDSHSDLYSTNNDLVCGRHSFAYLQAVTFFAGSQPLGWTMKSCLSSHFVCNEMEKEFNNGDNMRQRVPQAYSEDPERVKLQFERGETFALPSTDRLFVLSAARLHWGLHLGRERSQTTNTGRERRQSAMACTVASTEIYEGMWRRSQISPPKQMCDTS